MKLHYFGHSAFSLNDGTYTLVCDPFITENPWTKTDPQDISCQFIYISHGHGDHYGDAERIAKANDAIIIGTAEIAGKQLLWVARPMPCTLAVPLHFRSDPCI